MKLIRYGPPGDERPGLIDSGGRIRSLEGVLDDIGGESLLPASLERLRTFNPSDLSVVEEGVRLGACVGNVGKFVCVGLNYLDHADETGVAVPEEPVLFMKATSAISGPNDDVVLPRGAAKADWEVELGVVIGAPAKYVNEDMARQHIAGFCIVNDVSERAFQVEHGGQWVKGKSFDTSGPIGPWMVTTDEIPEPQDLKLWLEVDGYRHQESSTSSMIFGVDTIVSYVSQFMSLQSGDIIATGTPSGVGYGYDPQIWLQPGNVMRLGVEGLGVQRQQVLGAPH